MSVTMNDEEKKRWIHVKVIDSNSQFALFKL